VTLTGSTLGGIYLLLALVDAHKGRLRSGVVSWPRFWMGVDGGKRTWSPMRGARKRGRAETGKE
jgi:hypothetical protein